MTTSYSRLRKIVIGTTTAGVMLAALLGAPSSASADATNTLSGTVTGLDGSVLADGAMVSILDTNDGDASVGSYPTDPTTGAWTTGDLPDGAYEVEFVPNSSHYRTEYWIQGGTSFDADRSGTFTLPADGSVANDNLDASISDKGAARGTVVDSAGAGIPDVTVDVFDSNGPVASGTTNPDGSYQVWLDRPAPYDPTNYTIHYTPASGAFQDQWSGGASDRSQASPTTIADNSTLDTVTLAAGLTIAGTVTDAAGNPLAGVSVEVMDSNGQPVNSPLPVTADDGSYSVGGLHAAAYSVYFTKPGFGSSFNSVDLTTQSSATVNPSLTTSADIHGTITDPNGPVAGIDVDALDSNGNVVNFATTADDGTYEIDGLGYDTYTLQISAADPNPVGYVDLTSDPITLSKTNFDAKSDQELEIGGTITGSVTTFNDPSGQPEDVIVTAKSTQHEVEKSAFVSDFTGLKANYVITGLSAGTYTVEFAPQNDNGFASTWWKAATSEGAGTRVTVVSGATNSGISGTILKAVRAADLYVKAPSADHVDVGQTLSVAAHSKSVSVPAKVTSTYQWIRFASDDSNDESVIKGATKSTYTTVNADASYRVGVDIVQSATGYAPTTVEIIDEAPVGNAIFTTKGKFSLTGTLSTGNVLTVKTTGSFSPAATSTDYFWSMNGLRVPTSWSPTPNTMLLGWDDLGNGNPYDTGKGNNPPAAWITAAGDINVPEDASNPAGDPNSHDYPFEFTQLLHPQWNGQKLTVDVCASREFYKDYCKIITVKIARDLAKRVIPIVSTSGSRMTASAGTWHSSTWLKGTVKLSYQWFRGDTAIAGATSSGYTLTADDSGRLITVHVTGKASGYTTATTYSLNTTHAP